MSLKNTPKNKRRKKLKKPPTTLRYCKFCEKTTEFEYNPKIFHSECKECGGRLSKKEDKTNGKRTSYR